MSHAIRQRNMEHGSCVVSATCDKMGGYMNYERLIKIESGFAKAKEVSNKKKTCF